MSGRLDLYLGQTYAARNKGDATQAEAALKSLINADHTFRKDAETRLASLTPNILKRDHISRVHHDILTRMLND